MCNLYTYKMTAEDMRLLKGRYNLVGQDYLNVLSTKNDATAVFPNYEAPVIRRRGQERVIEPMRWGFPPPPFARVRTTVTNVRNVGKGFWRPYLVRESRCVVPATAFFEFDQQLRKPRWFQRPDGAMFFFAGIWRPWTGDRGTKAKPNVGDHLLFSFLTTEPNQVVAPIHPKAMPVLLLDKAAVEQWLTGSSEEALALQRPAADDALELLPIDSGTSRG
jgi:putative SOS response-associated peptidase YedK